ncbi:MAG: hypothetical protein ABSD49_11085 [Candidatus Bathyarchaeia archaeon]
MQSTYKVIGTGLPLSFKYICYRVPNLFVLWTYVTRFFLGYIYEAEGLTAFGVNNFACTKSLS